MERIPKYKYESATNSKINDSAIIIDLSLLTKRKIILNESSSCLRCDVIADRYFKNSFKQNIRSSRGLGSRKHFNSKTKIPGDFRSNFLTNSDNKNALHVYLAEKFIEKPIFQKNLVITYNDSILTNIEGITAEDEISNCDIDLRIKES